jgi:hypothetical protein
MWFLKLCRSDRARLVVEEAIEDGKKRGWLATSAKK